LPLSVDFSDDNEGADFERTVSGLLGFKRMTVSATLTDLETLVELARTMDSLMVVLVVRVVVEVVVYGVPARTILLATV
jgi:hypothetical protein